MQSSLRKEEINSLPLPIYPQMTVIKLSDFDLTTSGHDTDVTEDWRTNGIQNLPRKA